MKGIEKYIEFAIENGYMSSKLKVLYADAEEIELLDNQDGSNIEWNTIEIITSKEFIEAISRGYIKGWMYETEPGFLESTIHMITKHQAIAIRDNKLPEYINNLLGDD